MTTAIEQAKREMYASIDELKCACSSCRVKTPKFNEFETALEAYLEQLRQQYEEMASTAHQRFESIQSLEAANEKLGDALRMANGNTVRCSGISVDAIRDLESRLAKMTESRDMFRNLHQAATYASVKNIYQASTSGQTSGDRASCAATGGKMAVLVEAIDRCKREVELWEFKEVRARKAMHRIAHVVNGDPDVANAMRGNVSADGYGGWFINNDKCMHSFFAIRDGQMKCTFCGVGK